MKYTGNLPVLAEFVGANQTDVHAVSLLVVQHIKKNTVEFIRLLKEAGFGDITVIGKPYSVDADALKMMRRYTSVIVPMFAQLERISYMGLLVKKAIGLQPFLCFDLGGYLSKYFSQVDQIPSNLLGIIEETKNGIWFDDMTVLKMPLVSVAESHLKTYGEAYFVARALIRNTEHILINEFQETLAGKRILVLGYGMIGSQLAPLLQQQARVTVYDIRSSLCVKAKIFGFDVLPDLSHLADFDVIFGVTGNYVLKRELLGLKQNVVLVNGSTRKREFDFSAIARRIARVSEKKRYTDITLIGDKMIRLLAHGYPVNFFETESVPEHVLDLLYSEMFLLGQLLVAKKVPSGYFRIEKDFAQVEEMVAHAWLAHWAR